jgi:hypothetical protein
MVCMGILYLTGKTCVVSCLFFHMLMDGFIVICSVKERMNEVLDALHACSSKDGSECLGSLDRSLLSRNVDKLSRERSACCKFVVETMVKVFGDDEKDDVEERFTRGGVKDSGSWS